PRAGLAAPAARASVRGSTGRPPRHKPLVAAIAALLLAGCASTAARDTPPADATASSARCPTDAYPTTYVRTPSPPVLVTNAPVLTGDGARLDGADVLMADGRIVAVGRGLEAPEGATRVDGTGQWVTPGIIDV